MHVGIGLLRFAASLVHRRGKKRKQSTNCPTCSAPYRLMKRRRQNPRPFWNPSATGNEIPARYLASTSLGRRRRLRVSSHPTRPAASGVLCSGVMGYPCLCSWPSIPAAGRVVGIYINGIEKRKSAMSHVSGLSVLLEYGPRVSKVFVFVELAELTRIGLD